MSNSNAYYSSSITEFKNKKVNEILGAITGNNDFSTTAIQQTNTWEKEIKILQKQLSHLNEGQIIFEYTIPRMGKRVDVVLLHNNIVFLLEFKCGDKDYRSSTYDQVYDYALDLRNFHKESLDKLIVPIIVSTDAPERQNRIEEKDRIIAPLYCNEENLKIEISHIANKYNEKDFIYSTWENSEYLPTPTIIEAAQALYAGHNVREITRSDAGAENLTVTNDKINEIIEYSKKRGRKSICFVTGVPGAGKTLVGLNLAIQHHDAVEGEHAVFLSGNYPLVQVLREALSRDKVAQKASENKKVKKEDALRETSAFIQIIHKYRDSFIGNNNVPPEHVVIFDEAQRAWTHSMIRNFMKTKKKIENFNYSEPEFLISTMERHKDWAVIICLIGGGQEINTGEAGLPEWFDSLRRRFSHWDVYLPSVINDSEYCRDRDWESMLSGLNKKECKELHLANSVRSFRTPDLAAFIKAVLDADIKVAKRLYKAIADKYPIVITRDLTKAKNWVRNHSQGTTRYGLLASSGGLRLKSEGIFVKNNISVANWFLNEKHDVRSSYMLEDVVTEFDIQGLEVDYTVVAWDADYRYDNCGWTCHSFKGSKWLNVEKEERRLYLKNAYRVLLTRARQGMAIYVPYGSNEDNTRKCQWYDGTYNYLKEIGIFEL